MIKVSGLNKYYNKGKSNELHVINDTNITLEDTGLVCILGDSGSGKTTLMNTISGLDDFVSGSIDVDGIEVNKYGDPNQEIVRNEKFGYIFQNYYLLQDRTVEYNIYLSLSLYNLSDEEKEERIDYVLKAVDMWRYKKRLVSQLSGGQQQRIAIARALAKSPKVIFADEPTGNLDEANTMRTMSILKKVSKKCLVVVVTHEKTIADFFADRILWIADGKIEKEQYKESQTTYQYIEDTNIYLQEYEQEKLENEDVKVEIYNGKDKPKVDIKLICENGKIFISVGDSKNIELLTTDSEKQVIDSKKPVIEMQDIEEMEYELGELDSVKKPKLGLRKIREIAKSNIGSMGKKQIFLVLSLFVMSVMMVFAVQDIMTILNIDTQSVVTSDSHILNVKLEKSSLVTATQFEEIKKEYISSLVDKVDGMNDIVINPGASLIYNYEGFSQLENINSTILNYSYVSVDKLSEEDLYYGEMPKNDQEIVIDKWVLENFIETTPEMANVINDVKHFVGKTVKLNERNLTISGISETDEMSVYISPEEVLRLSKWSENYTTLSKFKELYPEYKDTELTIDENGNFQALRCKSDFDTEFKAFSRDKYADYYEYISLKNDDGPRRAWGWTEADFARYEQEIKDQMDSLEQSIMDEFGYTVEEMADVVLDSTGFTYEDKTSTKTGYSVIGYFPTEILNETGLEMVVSDEAVPYLWEDMLAYRGEFNIYSEDKDETIEMLNGILGEIGVNLNIITTDSYGDELSTYKYEKSKEFNGRIIVTITIFVISMIILYFMMKANAIQRMQDLGVYRLIGISKLSIIGLFAYENFLITSYTSLVGAVLATLVTKIISGIPSLYTQVNYPWYAFLGTVAFLYVVNILVGIMPIRKILRLPPAQLASKYDI